MTDPETLPAPFVPPEVDLRNFPNMPLGVARLRDSEFTSSVTAEEWRAGVLLWCASWHEVPAGSLRDDDKHLAKLAGYGFAIKEWQRVRDGALYGWTLCSDGLLYHPIVAEVVLTSWDSKLENEHRKLCDRLRKENKIRRERQEEEVDIPSFERWKWLRLQPELQGLCEGIPPETTNTSAGIPPENALKGREGKGTEGRVLSDSTSSRQAAHGLNGHNGHHRATRLPSDWRLPDEWAKWAMQAHHLEPDRVIRISLKFRDYWIAKSGRDATKADWFATWRNWVRKEVGDA